MNLQKTIILLIFQILILCSCVFIPLNDLKNEKIIKSLKLIDSNDKNDNNQLNHLNHLNEYNEINLKIKTLLSDLKDTDTESIELSLLIHKFNLIHNSDSDSGYSLVLLSDGIHNDNDDKDDDEKIAVLELVVKKHGMIAQGLITLQKFYFKFHEYKFDSSGSNSRGICLNLYDNEYSN